MLAKQLEYLAGAQVAGIVLGSRVPIVLTSRADKSLARLASCTPTIYAQFVPESQRRALAKMSAMAESRTSKPVAATGSISMPSQSRMVN